MNRLLFAAAFTFAALSGQLAAQAQTTSKAAEPNPWFTTDAAPAASATTTPDAAAPTYPTTWMSAPGMSLNPHGRPTTDYQGRPLKAKAPRKVLATAPPAEAPAYQTAWAVAPGMSLSGHQRPTTDYWGRPLKPAVRRRTASSLAATHPATKSASAVYAVR